ncbi:lasso RiPP family leader peptide-containing protein [Gemmatimonadota bacterium]
MTRNTTDAPETTTRRPYHAPRLREYGAIRELTAGGTWKAKETAKGKGVGPRKRP